MQYSRIPGIPLTDLVRVCTHPVIPNSDLIRGDKCEDDEDRGRDLEYLEYLRACRQLWTRRYMNWFNPLNSTNLFWYRLVHPLHHGQYIQAAAQRVITCVYSSASPTRATFSSACRNCSNASISRSPRRAPRVSTSLEGSSAQRYLRKKEEGRMKKEEGRRKRKTCVVRGRRFLG